MDRPPHDPVPGEDPPRSEPRPIARYRLTIAYDGTDFHGWQEQRPNPDAEPLRTVAGEIRAALQRLLRQPIHLVGASRTDAGVHALGQVAHFDAACPIPVDRLPHALTSRLPEDIDIRHAEMVQPDFDAIRDARRKQYRYRLHLGPHRPLLRRRTVHAVQAMLDPVAMNDAAARIEGEHDFAAFATAGHGRTTTVRRVNRCRVEPGDPRDDELHVVVVGEGFLYNMVRIIAGTLVEVGRGRFTPQHVDALLRRGDRAEAGPTLPPQGLCLEHIVYDDTPALPPGQAADQPVEQRATR